MNKKQEEIRAFLESLPDTFDILQEKVDLDTQKEYLDYSHSFGTGELSDEEARQLGEILNHPETPVEGKKKALSLLAHTGTVNAFRQIEKYYDDPDEELAKWAALALQVCKMFLESSLLDTSTGFIAGGLGGSGQSMRYYFLILSETNGPFTTAQKNIIKNEFPIAAKKLNCVVESIESSENYAGITALVPFDVAVGTLIENGIEACNELGDFVFEHYYVTNQDIPDGQKIEEIIHIVRSG